MEDEKVMKWLGQKPEKNSVAEAKAKEIHRKQMP